MTGARRQRPQSCTVHEVPDLSPRTRAAGRTAKSDDPELIPSHIETFLAQQGNGLQQGQPVHAGERGAREWTTASRAGGRDHRRCSGRSEMGRWDLGVQRWEPRRAV